jgi:hypothetical protein
MARVAVLEFEQSAQSTPLHFISRKLSARFLAYSHNGRVAVTRISQRIIKIILPLSFGFLKNLLRPRTITPRARMAPKNIYVPRRMPPAEIHGVYFEKSKAKEAQ